MKKGKGVFRPGPNRYGGRGSGERRRGLGLCGKKRMPEKGKERGVASSVVTRPAKKKGPGRGRVRLRSGEKVRGGGKGNLRGGGGKR